VRLSPRRARGGARASSHSKRCGVDETVAVNSGLVARLRLCQDGDEQDSGAHGDTVESRQALLLFLRNASQGATAYVESFLALRDRERDGVNGSVHRHDEGEDDDGAQQRHGDGDSSLDAFLLCHLRASGKDTDSAFGIEFRVFAAAASAKAAADDAARAWEQWFAFGGENGGEELKLVDDDDFEDEADEDDDDDDYKDKDGISGGSSEEDGARAFRASCGASGTPGNPETFEEEEVPVMGERAARRVRDVGVVRLPAALPICAGMDTSTSRDSSRSDPPPSPGHGLTPQTARDLRAFVLRARDDGVSNIALGAAAQSDIFSRVRGAFDASSDGAPVTRWDVRLSLPSYACIGSPAAHDRDTESSAGGSALSPPPVATTAADASPVQAALDELTAADASPVQAALDELLHGAVGDAFNRLLGADALLWELAAIVSAPGSPPQILHGDTVWTDDATTFTAFAALQDVERSCGPTRFVLGTHKMEDAHELYVEEPELFCENVDANVATLKIGEVSLYDSRVLHCGGAHVGAVGDPERVLFVLSFTKAGAQEGQNVDAYGAGSILPDVAMRGLRLRDFFARRVH